MVCSALFTVSETALLSCNRLRIKRLMEQGVPGAKTIDRFLSNTDSLLFTLAMGDTVADVAAACVATALITLLYGFSAFNTAVTAVSVVAAVLVIGEFIPKLIGSSLSCEAVCKMSGLIRVLSVALFPVNLGFNAIKKLTGRTPPAESELKTDMEEDLKAIVNVSETAGVLEQDESEMIRNVFIFGDSFARDVMIPRTDMVAIHADSTYDEAALLFASEQFSRVPVYGGSLDDIIGVIYMKDLLLQDVNRKDFSVKNLLRPAYFAFEMKPTPDLFREMRMKHIPMAIIVDEYGQTAGLVTLEDLVEEIVGDIFDEYDVIEDQIRHTGDGEYITSASTKISDFNKELNVCLESEDYDTIGGYVLGVLGHVPETGESVSFNGLTVTVMTAEKNRIRMMKVLKV